MSRLECENCQHWDYWPISGSLKTELRCSVFLDPGHAITLKRKTFFMAGEWVVIRDEKGVCHAFEDR